MPRTNAQKRAEVRKLLRNSSWRKRSTTWIARKLGLSWNFVDKVRTQMGDLPNSKRLASDGKQRPANQAKKHGLFS